MSTVISTNSNGEAIIHDGDKFLKQDFQYTEPKSYKDILTDSTPVYKAQDTAQKQTIECLVGKINMILQDEVRSDECYQHANNGETHYVSDTKLKAIWDEVGKKFGKRAEAVKQRLLNVAGKNLSKEGYIFLCEKSNTENPDKWKIVRDVKNTNIGKSFLDKWLDEDEPESEVQAKPEDKDADVILPDNVQIPRQPQPESSGTEE